ncbi:MAG: choice-of-anchor D domain-containing protein [bacterium]
MKKVIFLFVFLISYTSYSQSLTVFDADASGFSTIKANFYALDFSGKRILNFSISDFEITENGQQRTVLRVSCPTPKQPIPISSVLTIDISGSMKGSGIDIAKQAAKAWVDLLPMATSECAVTSFGKGNYINHDFTTNSNKLLTAINNLQVGGGTDYDDGLWKPLAGSLEISKKAKYKRVIVFFTDGMPNDEPQTVKIIAEANAQNAAIYAVTLGMSTPKCLKDITTKTGGRWYENVNTVDEAREIYRQILHQASGEEPCVIEWESKISCNQLPVKVNVKLLTLNLSSNLSYISPSNAVAKLEFSPSFLIFKNSVLGVQRDTTITVTARSADFNISNITCTNPAFSIDKTSFVLPKDQSTALKVSFTATDVGYTSTKFTFENNICPVLLFVNGHSKGDQQNPQTLKLTVPNGGEEFVVGSDTLIKWEGISELDTVELEYSIDDEKTWTQLTYKASGLEYLWRNIPKPESKLCKVRAKQIINTESIIDEPLLTLVGHNNTVNKVNWSPDGSRVATSARDSSSIIWNAISGEIMLKLNNHSGNVIDITWSPDGSKIATACGDGFANIWDAKTGNQLQTIFVSGDFLLKATWNPDGNRLAFLAYDKTYILIGDATTGAIIQTLNDGNHFHSIKWSPDGNRLVSTDGYQCATIWDAKTGKILHKMSGHNRGANDACWSPDGTKVASGDGEGIVIIWDAITGNMINLLKGHTKSIMNVSWSPDGNYLATTSDDSTAIIWDGSTGAKLHTLKGLGSREFDDVRIELSWSPDGSKIAIPTGTFSSAIIWDVQSGTKIHTLVGHSDYVFHLSWSPDGDRIATASFDGTAKIWFLDYLAIQKDVSDAVFSIVEPKAELNNIDMKQCLLGTAKDSLINNVVKNIGTYKFRVDSVYFNGADANSFKFITGLPKYVLNPGDIKSAEIQFKPTRIGIHSAQINIVTQAEIITKDIIGEGIMPSIEVVGTVIDFGRVGVGISKDKKQAFTIKNVGNSPIQITKSNHNKPNDYDFTQGNGGAFILEPNEIKKMDLRFTPSDAGRTCGLLEFHYNGAGSPAVVNLFGEGVIISSITAVLTTDNLAGYPGDTVNIPIILKNEFNVYASDIKNLKCEVLFNPTILAPIDLNQYPVTIINDTTAKIVIDNIPLDGDLGEPLIKIPFKVALGNAEGCDLILQNAVSNDGKAVIQTENGKFTLLGICYDGGTRLINPTGKVEIMQIKPNPANEDIEIGVNLIEKEYSLVSVFNSNGVKMKEFNLSGKTGFHNIKLNISEFSNGLYFVQLQTPTIVKNQKLMIIK